MLARRHWLIVAGAGCVMVLLLVVGVYAAKPRVSENASAGPLPTAPAQQASIGAGVPVRLKIPAIGVDAPIDAMGLTDAGDMASPSGGRETGWYKNGPHPGNEGSAVIAGHYGQWQNGEGSVFDKLHTLKPGDKVYVVDQGGVTRAFTVREARLFGRDDEASSVFISSDRAAHLNLITCQGEWNAKDETYADRLVVFADLE